MAVATLRGEGYDVLDELEASLDTNKGQEDWGYVFGELQYAIKRRGQLKGHTWSWRGDLYGFTRGKHHYLVRDAGVNSNPRFTLIAVRPTQEQRGLEELARARLADS